MYKLNKDQYEVLTPSGWKDFAGIQEIKKKGQTKLIIDGNELICSTCHPLLYNNSFVVAKDVPSAITIEEGEFTYYDLLSVDEHLYYTNSIISHNCDFIGSSGTLIAGWKLKELVHQMPIRVKEGLYQYEMPIKDHRYAMVCDVSRGKGLDYSAFQLVDVTQMPYQQACVFRDNSTTPADYASVIFRTAMAYNNASVLVEINDIGEQVAHNLHHDLGYEHILYTVNAGRSGKKVTAGFGGSPTTTDKGIRTTKIVKSVGCSLLKLLIEQNQFIVNDHETIKELFTFSKKAQSYEAEPGFHDDLVMSLVLFAWLADQEYFKELTDINTLMALRDKTEEEIEDSLLVFGFVDDGREDEPYWKNVDADYWTPIPQLDREIQW